MTSDDRSPEQLDPTLERVYRRGYRLRFRRKLARGLSSGVAVVLIVSAAAVGVAKVQDRNDRGAVAIVPRSPDPSANVAPSVKNTPSLHPSARPSPSPSPIRSTPTNACHNSTDEACGKFFWITPPGSNAPLKITIDVTTENPVAGEPVTVVVTVSDADASHIYAWDNPNWGDPGVAIGFALRLVNAYGGWTPPAKRAGSEAFTFGHTYAEAGSYRFSIGGLSSSGAPWGGESFEAADPYRSELTRSITIDVGPNPTPTPSPTSS